MFRVEGMPKEMADLVGATADLIGEAIVALIEGEGDSQVVDNSTLTRMRVATDENAPSRQVSVHCRCDKNRTDPLAVLTVTASPYVVVPGKQLIAGLADRDPKCPHERKS